MRDSENDNLQAKNNKSSNQKHGYLIIKRKKFESVIIKTNDGDIEVSISKIASGEVSLAICAPKHIDIKRGELLNQEGE
jgi:carbon storage regulator CsrA